MSSKRKEGRKCFYFMMHFKHFNMVIWCRTIQIARKETRCRYMSYSFRLAARGLLYAPSHRQDSTYHGLCYTSHGALAETRNSSIGSTMKDRSDDYHTMNEHSYHRATSRSPLKVEGENNGFISILLIQIFAYQWEWGQNLDWHYHLADSPEKVGRNYC